MMHEVKKIISNEKGIALVMVLLVLTVTSFLGLALTGLTLNNMKMSTVDRNYQSTYYIAESGITYTMDIINKNILDIYNTSIDESNFFLRIENMITNINNQPPFNNFEDHFGYTPEVKVLIENFDSSNPNYREYKISSLGTIDNHSRTVEKVIGIKWIQNDNNIELPNTAVFVKETIDLSGGAAIKGGAGTNSSESNSITLNGGASISGNVYIGPNSGNKVIDKPDWMDLDIDVIKLPNTKSFELPQFQTFPSYPIPPNETISKDQWNKYDVIKDGSLRIDSWISDNYTLNMTQDMQFKEIILESNNTLNIYIGNNNRSIVVDHLNIKNGKFNIIGSGTLSIYVNEKITMGAGSVLNPIKAGTNLEEIMGHIRKLDIHYNGTDLDMAGAQKIYGSLYAKNADITMTGGSGFQGHIISGGRKVKISGGANAITQLFYTPNADVTLSGGGRIKGSIIANSYTSSGGTEISNEDFHLVDLPPIFGESSGVTVSPKDIILPQPTHEK